MEYSAAKKKANHEISCSLDGTEQYVKWSQKEDKYWMFSLIWTYTSKLNEPIVLEYSDGKAREGKWEGLEALQVSWTHHWW